MKLKCNCCDGIYNSFDVHFTSACDNKCAHCIDKCYDGLNISKSDVNAIVKTIVENKEGLDDVLLKLASKWDTLDFTTQRYIATTAAGSRQQSRFIAMMSDYGRTQELVSAAYNSAGASQEQFEKEVHDKLNNEYTIFRTT